jgi:O-antigen/teichoic acid export membrane protein
MTCRLEIAIPLLENREQFGSLLLTIGGFLVAISGLIGLACLFVVTIGIPFSIRLLHWGMPLAVAMALINISTMALTWKRRYVLSVILSFWLAVTILGSQWLLAVFGKSYATRGLENGAIIGYAIFGLISLIICICYVDKWNISYDDLVHHITNNKNIMLYTTCSNLLYFVSSNWPLVLFGRFFGPAVVGAFAMGKKLIDAGSRVIDGSFRNIIYGEYSFTRDRNRFRNLARKNIQFVVIICCLVGAIILLAGKQIVILTLGARWTGIDTMVLYLLPFFVGVNGLMVHKAVINAERKNRLLFILDLIIFVLRPVVIVFFALICKFSANSTVLCFSLVSMIPVFVLTIKIRRIL